MCMKELTFLQNYLVYIIYELLASPLYFFMKLFCIQFISFIYELLISPLFNFQLCTGIDEKSVGSSFQLVFAPIDDHFPDDTPLISSGFRVIPLDMKTVKHCQRPYFFYLFFPLFRQLLGFLVAIILSRLSFAIIQNGSLICYNLIRIKCKIVHLPLHILF